MDPARGGRSSRAAPTRRCRGCSRRSPEAGLRSPRARRRPPGTRSARTSAPGSTPPATSDRSPSSPRRTPPRAAGQRADRSGPGSRTARPPSSPSRARRSRRAQRSARGELAHGREAVREHERAVLERALEPHPRARLDPDATGRRTGVCRRPSTSIGCREDEPSRPSACRITNCPLRCTSAGPVPGLALASVRKRQQHEPCCRRGERGSRLGDPHPRSRFRRPGPCAPSPM